VRDPTGEAGLFGAALGAVADAAIQGALVAVGVQEEFSWSSVAISAASGATGVGLLSVLGKAKALRNAGRLVQATARAAGETAVETGTVVAEQIVNGEAVDLGAAVKQAVVAQTIGAGSGALADRATKALRGSTPSVRPVDAGPDGGPGGCFAAGTRIATTAGLVPIEQVSVGDRVLTALGSAETTQVDASWRVISVLMPHPDGAPDLIELELLRPTAWLVLQGAAPGRWIELELSELEVSGPAYVHHIRGPPVVAPGPGRVVLAALTHVSNDLVDLHVEGLATPLRATANHPLASATRSAWVAAGGLKPGEHLQTSVGATRVLRIEHVRAPERVYNVEVEADHEYLVSEIEIRSHNTSEIGKIDPADVGPLKGDTDTVPVFSQRGVDPAPGSRTRQSVVDELVESTGGNPTVQRGGTDLFRVRRSGHGRSGASATPVNVRRTAPDGRVFTGQTGPDKPVGNREIREIYKATTDQDTSSVRTRGRR
jgi:hypothetical protein